MPVEDLIKEQLKEWEANNPSKRKGCGMFTTLAALVLAAGCASNVTPKVQNEPVYAANAPATQYVQPQPERLPEQNEPESKSLNEQLEAFKKNWDDMLREFSGLGEKVQGLDKGLQLSERTYSGEIARYISNSSVAPLDWGNVSDKVKSEYGDAIAEFKDVQSVWFGKEFEFDSLGANAYVRPALLETKDGYVLMFESAWEGVDNGEGWSRSHLYFDKSLDGTLDGLYNSDEWGKPYKNMSKEAFWTNFYEAILKSYTEFMRSKHTEDC